MSKPSRMILAGSVLVAIGGFALFQFFGNATRSYIVTHSAFIWLFENWMNPGSESEHGPLLLLLSTWLFWRNLRSDRVKFMDRSEKIGFVFLVSSLGFHFLAYETQKEIYSVLFLFLYLGGFGVLSHRLSADRQPEDVPAFFFGFGLIMLSLACHLLGYLVQQTRISLLGFLIFLVGLAYLAKGKRWGRAAVFPCFLLLFALPMSFLTDQIGFQMRLHVTHWAHFITSVLGFDVIRNGTQLLSSDGIYQYDVAPACSGIRSLLALCSLTLIIGYINFSSWIRRGLLFLLCFPFSFFGNVIRIFSIIVAAEWFGSRAGDVVHEWFGFVIFIIVLMQTYIAVYLFQRIFPERNCPEKTKSPEIAGSPKIPPKSLGGFRVEERVLIPVIFGVMIIAIAASAKITRVLDTATVKYQCGVILDHDGQNPVSLPDLLGVDWAGRFSPVTPVEKDYLPDDTGFSRMDYVNLLNPRKRVFFSIVLSGRDRTSIHRPEICLRGQGWTIKGRFDHDFKLPKTEGGRLRTSVLRIERSFPMTDGSKQVLTGLYAYWFVGGDQVVHTHWKRMAIMAWDRLFRLQNHRWAYVTAHTVDIKSEEDSLDRLEEVIGEVLPLFQKPGLTAGSGD